MMAQTWGSTSATTNTTTGNTYYVGFSYDNGGQGTQASAWSWSLRDRVNEFKQVLTEKQLRDRADAVRAAVRAPPGPPPPAKRARHGHYAGPRLSCHSATRNR